MLVAFDTDEALDEAWIEVDGDATAPVRDLDGTHGEGLVLAPPGTEVHLRVRGRSGTTAWASDERVVVTGELPAELSVPEVTDHDPAATWGSYVLSGYTDLGSNSAMWLLDRTGRVVWYHLVDGAMLAGRPSRDGRALIYLHTTSVPGSPDSEICRFDLDGEHTSCVPTPMAHHDFVELPDGGLAYPQNEQLGPVLSDNFVLQAPDGSVRELWSAEEDIGLEHAPRLSRAGSRSAGRRRGALAPSGGSFGLRVARLRQPIRP